MREVATRDITAAVEKLFLDAAFDLSNSMTERLECAARDEVSPMGRAVLEELLENARIARTERVPMCQDTGLAVVFAQIGQDVHVVGGSLEEAVAQGVKSAYREGYLRKSCCDPLTRANTGDNTPPILHVWLVPGEGIRIRAMAKGGGSENCSEVRMLSPSQGVEGVKTFVLDMVKRGGANPCPPIIVGVGVGGNFETSALLSKEALMVPFGERNTDSRLAVLELDMLQAINGLGIGPAGYGGLVTALDVHVKMLPCHIASLPVAVNIQCHAHRIQEITL